MQLKTKLSDAMAKLPDNAIMKIGTENGSAFLFVGTKAKWEEQKQALTEREQEADERYVLEAYKKIRRQVDEIEKAIKTITTAKTLIATYNERILESSDCRNVDLDDRDVLSVTPSIDKEEKDSTIIIVRGFSDGKYWSVSEAEWDKKKKSK